MAKKKKKDESNMLAVLFIIFFIALGWIYSKISGQSVSDWSGWIWLILAVVSLVSAGYLSDLANKVEKRGKEVAEFEKMKNQERERLRKAELRAKARKEVLKENPELKKPPTENE